MTEEPREEFPDLTKNSDVEWCTRNIVQDVDKVRRYLRGHFGVQMVGAKIEGKDINFYADISEKPYQVDRVLRELIDQVIKASEDLKGYVRFRYRFELVITVQFKDIGFANVASCKLEPVPNTRNQNLERRGSQ